MRNQRVPIKDSKPVAKSAHHHRYIFIHISYLIHISLHFKKHLSRPSSQNQASRNSQPVTMKDVNIVAVLCVVASIMHTGVFVPYSVENGKSYDKC